MIIGENDISQADEAMYLSDRLYGIVLNCGSLR